MDAMDYALSIAPPDVAEAIGWLQMEGFVLCQSQGGPSESFGDVLLDFGRAGIHVQVVRDRSQWMMDIAPAEERDRKYRTLAVMLSAMRGDAEIHIASRLLDAPLPDQLPDGERWSVAVPAVIAWLMAADRAFEIGRAERRWRLAMKEHLDSYRPKRT